MYSSIYDFHLNFCKLSFQRLFRENRISSQTNVQLIVLFDLFPPPQRLEYKMADNHVSMAVVFDVPEGTEFK